MEKGQKMTQPEHNQKFHNIHRSILALWRKDGVYPTDFHLSAFLMTMIYSGLPDRCFRDPKDMLLFDRLCRKHIPETAFKESPYVSRIQRMRWPYEWFWCPPLIEQLCQHDHVASSKPYPLFDFILAVKTNPLLLMLPKMPEMFDLVLQQCRNVIHVNVTYRTTEKTLEMPVLSAVLAGKNIFQAKKPEIFDRYMDIMLLPLLYTGADVDAPVIKGNPHSILHNYVSFIPSERPRWTMGPDQRFYIILVWMLRFTRRYPSQMDVDVFLYTMLLALEEEARLLLSIPLASNFPPFLAKRVGTSDIVDTADIDVAQVNPFTYQYTGLIRCIRKFAGFPMAVRDVESFPDGFPADLEEKWYAVVKAVHNVVQAERQSGALRDRLGEECEHRYVKKSKMGE